MPLYVSDIHVLTVCSKLLFFLSDYLSIHIKVLKSLRIEWR